MKSRTHALPRSRHVAWAVAGLAAAMLSGCNSNGGSSATSAAAVAGPAVETVNGEAVPQALLDLLAKQRNVDQSNPEQRERLLKQLTDVYLLAQAADKQDFGKDPDFAAAAEMARLEGVAGAAIKQLQKTQEPTDADLRTEYDAEAAKGGTPEYDFSQIVFADKAQADKAQAEASGGKPFDQVMDAYRKDAKMARNFPKVRSAMLPEPLATTLASLKAGENAKAPVQLPQGWAVVHLNQTSTVPQAPFEQVKDGMRRAKVRKVAEEQLEKLRAAATIKLTDPPPPAAPFTPRAMPPKRMQMPGTPPQRPGQAPPGPQGQPAPQPQVQLKVNPQPPGTPAAPPPPPPHKS